MIKTTSGIQTRFLSPLNVLIVDDHPSMRQLIRALLNALAGEIGECADGTSAVEVCRERQPAWVTMDLQMPGIDGIEATRRILAVSPGTRVIIVTDFDQPNLRAAALRAGAITYLLKEDLGELHQLLKIETV